MELSMGDKASSEGTKQNARLSCLTVETLDLFYGEFLPGLVNDREVGVLLTGQWDAPRKLSNYVCTNL